MTIREDLLLLANLMLHILLIPAAAFALHVTTPVPGLSDTVPAPATTDSVIVEVTLTADHGALLSQLGAETKKARKQGRTPIIDVGASWCQPCHIVERVFRQPAMQATMRGVYLIHLDLDVWKSDLEALGVEVGGIPRVVAVDTTGRPSGEPWRPRDIPPAIQQHGVEAAFQETLITFCDSARTRFTAAASPAKK